MPRRAPRWARRWVSAQDEQKAARLAVLYRYRDQLAAIPKTAIAAALGVSRWTIDRDLAALEAIGDRAEPLRRRLAEALEA